MQKFRYPCCLNYVQRANNNNYSKENKCSIYESFAWENRSIVKMGTAFNFLGVVAYKLYGIMNQIIRSVMKRYTKVNRRERC